MLGSDVFLFPDFGESFLRSVKTNALYARRLSSSILTLSDDSEVASWSEALERAKQEDIPAASKALMNRCQAYFEFALQAQPTLKPMIEAGILRAPNQQSILRFVAATKEGGASGSIEADIIDKSWVLDRFKSADPSLLARLRRASHQMPPSVLDVLVPILAGGKCLPTLEDFQSGKANLWWALMTLSFGPLHEHVPPEFAEPVLQMFGGVLIIVGECFGRQGIPFVWTDPILQDGMWAVHQILSPSPNENRGIQKGPDPEQLLGSTIVEAYLPVIHDLPIDEILNFRTKHEAELEAFRSGVGELAGNIDVSQTPADIERQGRELVRNKVNPAVRDLRAKLKIARLDALQKIGKSWQSVASLTFPWTIAVLAGAPVNFGALAGVAGSIAQAFFEGAIERKKLLHASQWSALIRFDDLRRDS